jgi:hypothetical protein
VAIAILAIAEGAAAEFVFMGIAGFLSLDLTLFCNKMSQICQNAANFLALRNNGNQADNLARAAAEPTLLFKHIIALC